ncbi:MAG TPA: hypothetical protein VEK15_28675 [Vicinamibacteria bacterium]|nr:hypothetical protein [Vicinamibacteria bacterium]
MLPTTDVAPDGRLLLLTPGDSGAVPEFEITVVIDWTEELKRLVP